MKRHDAMAEKEGKGVEVFARIEWIVLALLLVGLGLALRHLPVREALESVTMRLEALGWMVLSGYGLAATASIFTGNRPEARGVGSARSSDGP